MLTPVPGLDPLNQPDVVVLERISSIMMVPNARKNDTDGRRKRAKASRRDMSSAPKRLLRRIERVSNRVDLTRDDVNN